MVLTVLSIIAIMFITGICVYDMKSQARRYQSYRVEMRKLLSQFANRENEIRRFTHATMYESTLDAVRRCVKESRTASNKAMN